MPDDYDGAALPSLDMYDWPCILYVGRVLLHYTDEQTMNLTPKQFKNQWDVHVSLQKQRQGKQADTASPGFIDQMPGW